METWRSQGLPGPEGLDEEREANPFLPRGELVEIGTGNAFVSAFANVSAFETSDGLVCVDSARPSRHRRSTG